MRTHLLIAYLDPDADVLLQAVSVSDPRRVTLVEDDEVAIFAQNIGGAEIVRARVPDAVAITDEVSVLTRANVRLLEDVAARFEVGCAIRLAIRGEAQVRRIEEALAGWPVVMGRLEAA